MIREDVMSFLTALQNIPDGVGDVHVWHDIEDKNIYEINVYLRDKEVFDSIPGEPKRFLADTRADYNMILWRLSKHVGHVVVDCFEVQRGTINEALRD